MSGSTSNAGRPPMYDDMDGALFQQRGNEYLMWCLDSEKRPTLNGLSLALGFNSRQSLLNYAEKPEFMDIIKRFRTVIESEWEYALADPNATGTIFWLKNQGWSDKSETEIYGRNGGPMETVTRIELVGKQ